VLASLSFADDLTGVVTNGTTGRPSSGDDVILLKLGEGMEEGARTKSDSKGNFTLKVDDNGPHLVRVVHQGVTYHRMAPPGTTSVEVQVFDAAKKVAGVSVTADVMRFQAQGSELDGVRLFAVDNKSSPPRTQMSDTSVEFYLPEGAVVDSGSAQTEGGNPLKLMPVPQDEKNSYAFIFPIRPGQTTLELEYHMPYSGTLSVDPKPLYAAQHFVVMLPKSMQFTPAAGADFKSMQNPKEPDSAVQVASNTQVGQSLGFTIAGTGLLSSTGESGGGDGGGGDAEAQGRDSRPGGGLGPPIDAPKPLQKYMWAILALFGVALTAGAIVTARRPAGIAAASAARSVVVSVPVAGSSPAQTPAPGGSLLLAALKEELFELEMEHKQGKLSQTEYDKAKAALDQTLERALKRAKA
jgi:hypothetical protein